MVFDSLKLKKLYTMKFVQISENRLNTVKKEGPVVLLPAPVVYYLIRDGLSGCF